MSGATSAMAGAERIISKADASGVRRVFIRGYSSRAGRGPWMTVIGDEKQAASARRVASGYRGRAGVGRRLLAERAQADSVAGFKPA